LKFIETRLAGAFVIELEPQVDERGFFARAFCEREFAAHGLCARYPQSNLSGSLRAQTLRGMHYQAAPHREAKLVRCVSGAIHDVVADLRADSPTRYQWVAVELTARNRRALYVPPGFAHGFLTLEEEAEVLYQMGEFYVPEAARGFRFDDPRFAIAWPRPPLVISERDRGYPDFDPASFDG
jgi:dTDP-4-dehydrorhamnose 3,5-epimerase